MSSIGNPFIPIHPGGLVKDELESRGLSQRAFAHKFGISYPMLNEILNEKRPISTDFALFLEAALGISAGLLVRMQTSYNLQVAQEDKSLMAKLKKIQKIAAVF
ncbi:MAG: HigA family addiction module antidote protein [Prevotellaceae bacterium]|jgi:addiction module HigA family antidote|nr:HigA family addiction module antidote protein [Prevotellaceae bacterium]